MRRIWIYDEENLANFHCSVYIDRDSDEMRVFEISSFKNELNQLKQFIHTEVAGLWGFNNNEYDDLLLDYKLKKLHVTAEELYEKSTYIINSDERTWAKLPIPTSDIYRMLHFNRFGVSLKWCQFVMGSESIEEMPIEHYELINNRVIAEKVIKYCIWDVNQTKKVLKLHEGDVQIRRDLKLKYPQLYNVFSMSNTAMGKMSMLHDYCNITKDDPQEIKNKRTLRRNVTLSEIIDDRISFKSKALQDFLTYLKNKKTNLVVKELDEYLYFQKMHYVLKKGGLHGTEGQRLKKGKNYKVDTRYIYEENDHELLLDLDFSSFYPYVMQVLGIAPAHLNKEVFIGLVSKYTSERIYHKENNNKKEAAELKIKINSLFGQMGDKDSFLFDLKAMYQVTINGQLLLLMMIEQLAELGAICWYGNTDGASFIVNKKHNELILNKAKEFASWINIPLEEDYFKKAFIKDVNNFIIVKSNGKLKLKGAYVYEDIPMTKNPSNIISSKAAVKYMVEGKPIIDTIKEETSILSFCIGRRAKKTSKGLPVFTWFKDGDSDYAYPQQKTIRYIISPKGGVLRTVYDGDFTSGEYLEVHPHKDRFWYTTMLNKLQSYDVKDYDIDFMYYQFKANNLCKFKPTSFQGQLNQLTLF